MVAIASTQEMAVRRAGRADAKQISRLFEAYYVNSSHPFQSLIDVEEFLADDRNFEVVVESGGRIIAGAAMTYWAWNDSYELGRAITDPDFQKKGLAGLVIDQAVREVCARKLGSVFFGFPRVRRTAEVGPALNPPFVPVGRDGGRNKANGHREVHLIISGVPAYARRACVTPKRPEILNSRFILKEIYEPMQLEARPAEYPPDLLIGPNGGKLQEDGFLLKCESSRNAAVEVTGFLAPVNDPAEICFRLAGLLERRSDIQHMTVTVLADKVALIRELVNIGFTVSAYLPAWYPSETQRFDCVQLVYKRYSEEARVFGLDDILAGLQSNLPQVFSPPPVRSESVWQPQVFRWSDESQRRTCRDLMQRPGIQVFDTLQAQLADLIRSRHPGAKLTAEMTSTLVRNHVAEASFDEYGAWIYYPWSSRLVHLLDETEFVELRTNRNHYKITHDEQRTLATKTVGVVGLSVGQSVALTLALERAFSEIRLADFDSVDLSNLNRLRTGTHNLGVSKAVVTAREILEIDPYLKVSIFPDGVSSDNLESFLTEGGRLDAVIDECDSIDIKCLVRESARKLAIPVVMETSDRGMLDIERFDQEPNRPLFHGLAGDFDPASMRGLTNEQKVPFVLRIIGADTISPRLRASLIEIDETVSTWPQLASAVSLGGGIAADAVRRILLNGRAPSGRYFLDLEHEFAEKHSAKEVPDKEVAPALFVATAQEHPSDAVKLSRQILEGLVHQACRAPSGGNTQPWLWRSDGPVLNLLLDANRCIRLDFEFRSTYVALGAASENLCLAAHNHGLEVIVRHFPSKFNPRHVAAFEFRDASCAGAEAHICDDLYEQIPRRHTNRRSAPRQPVSRLVLGALTTVAQTVPGAELHWVDEPEQLEEIGRMIGAGDRLRMLHPEHHREMFREIRWTPDEAAATRDGVDVDTLYLSATDRAGLVICSDWSALELIRKWDLGKKLENISQKLVRGASAVGLLTMPCARPVDFFNGGRAMQRMWLAATQHGLAVHPMTTLPYFFAAAAGHDSSIDNSTAAELQELREPYERLLRPHPGSAEVLLFRISLAEAADRRSLRRPIEDVLT